MAITLDWENRIIHIPRASMALVQTSPSEIREQSLVTLFALLREQEASDIGMLYPPTLEYVKAFSMSGANLAPGIRIINGYSVTFEDGQYAVNLVGANSNVADCVNVNQVSVRSANSAGLVQTREIEQAAFGNMVAIDATKGSGTAYPMGTLQSPVNNWIDAMFIANLRGIDKFHVIGTFPIGPTDIISGFNFIGNGMENTKMTLAAGCATGKTTFRDMTVSGFQDGETHYIGCEILSLSGVHCRFIDCLLTGPMTMEEGTYADTTVLVDCYTGWDRRISAPALKDELIVDLHNSSVNMAFNGFNGKVKFINLDHTLTPGTIAVNLSAGKVTIDSTCTTGTIKVRGDGELVNQSGGTTVDNDTTANLVTVGASALTPEQATMLQEAHTAAIMALAEAKLARQMATNKVLISTDDKTVTIYNDDVSAPLHQFNISDDKRIRTPA